MIFSVDPGSAQSAYVFFDPAKQRIIDMGILPNDDMLKQIKIGTPRMTVFAIERVASFGFSVGKEIFATCEWTGRFIQAAAHHPVTIFPIYRKQVVVAVTGKSTNGDKEVRAAMIARYGKENLDGCVRDLWSALAIATVASDRLYLSGGVGSTEGQRLSVLAEEELLPSSSVNSTATKAVVPPAQNLPRNQSRKAGSDSCGRTKTQHTLSGGVESRHVRSSDGEQPKWSGGCEAAILSAPVTPTRPENNLTGSSPDGVAGSDPSRTSHSGSSVPPAQNPLATEVTDT